MRSRRWSAALLALVACTQGPPGTAGRPTATPTASASAAPSRPADTAWRELPPAPVAVQEVATAVVGTKAYVAGGLLADRGVSRDVFVYDLDRRTWSRGPQLPVAVHHPAGAAFEGHFMVIGGLDPGGRPSNRTFFLTDDEWVEGPRFEHARGAAAAVAIGDKVVLAGGIDGSSHVRETEVFDGETWSPAAPIPTLRDHLAGASDGRLVYMAGGRAQGRSLATLEAFDLATNKWQSLPAMPTARSGFGAAFVAGRVVAVGGEMPGVFDEAEAFDPAARTWSSLPRLRTGRHGHALLGYQRTVLALVGGDRQGLSPTRTCEAITL